MIIKTPDAVCKRALSNSRGVVVSQHRRASEAGVEILREGGNAMDAALATAFSLGSLEPWMSGIGAGGCLLIGRPGEPPSLVDFGLRSPSGIRAEDYPIIAGRSSDLFPWPLVKDERNTLGALSVCAPTMAAGMDLAWREFGSLPWDLLLQPAIEFAKEGIPVDWYTQLILGSVAKDMRREPVARSMFLDEVGGPVTTRWNALEQPRLDMGALPDTLSFIAKEGGDSVTRGDVATTLVKDVKDRGGVLNMQDFASCKPRIAGLTSTRYRGNKIWSASELSGGGTLARILDKLEGADLSADIDGSFYCALVDAIIPALNHREMLGDRNTSGGSQSCTTHFCVADADGLVVSATITLVSMFGSKVLSPRTGIMLNNGISWFDPVPGKPNSIGPDKPCLSNMAPTLVDTPDHGMLAIGAAGGRKIIPAMVQFIAFMLDAGLTLEEAFFQPRIDVHGDRTIIVDDRLDKQVHSLLRSRGEVYAATATIFPYHFGILGALKLSADSIEAISDITSPRGGAVGG